MVLNTDFDLSLDIDEINAQIEEESLMPALCVESKYDFYTYTDRDDGSTHIVNVWKLDWQRLDQDLGNFLYRSSHNLPDANSDKPTTNRRQQTYVQQVTCFGKVGLRGKRPEDFLNQKHWIREVQSGYGQYTKTWYKSEAIYIEGQSYEDAMNHVNLEVDDINPPSVAETDNDDSSTSDTGDETPDNPNNIYGILIDTIDGLTHRQALAAVSKSDDLKDNKDITEGMKNGTLIEQLLDQSMITEDDGKYNKV